MHEVLNKKGFICDMDGVLYSGNKIIEGVKEISSIIGKDNTVIRYDPIFLNDKYNIDYHKKNFKVLCEKLDGYINTIIVSFLDEYQNVKKNYRYLKYRKFTEEDYKEIGTYFSKVAKEHNITVQTCFEVRNLCEYGFIKGDCISKELAYKMTGKSYSKWTARKGNKCNCVKMVDIGEYNTCNHMCRYCYANFDEKMVMNNMKKHDPNSPLLIGKLESDDIIKERKK